MSLRFSRLAALILAAATSSLWAAPVVVNGRINNIDGDHDGAVDDLKISRIRFNVTAGTTVFFDSLVWESTGVDLNHDGYLTGFDNYMALLSGSQWLTAQDDSNQTWVDGSVHGYDSAYGYTFAQAGTYLVTLGQLAYNTADALQGYQANRAFRDYQSPLTGRGDREDSFGAWRLTMTASNGSLSQVAALDDGQVPEPMSLALAGLGLLGVGVARRKKA